MLKARLYSTTEIPAVQGQRKGYKATLFFCFWFHVTHSFLNIHPWGLLSSLLYRQGVGLKYKADKTKTPLRRQWCLIVIED